MRGCCDGSVKISAQRKSSNFLKFLFCCVQGCLGRIFYLKNRVVMGIIGNISQLFCDRLFICFDDEIRINTEQIFKQLTLSTDVRRI